jgi:long-chain acyl-CoA synthetase
MNNPLYSDRELEHQFNDSGAKVLITLDLLGNRMIDLRPKPKSSRSFTPASATTCLSQKPSLSTGGQEKKAGGQRQARPGSVPLETAAGCRPSAPKADLSFDDVAMYQYTGGTTGVSKGVMLTHGNLSKQVQQTPPGFPASTGSDEIMLGALPFFHVFGLTTAMNWPSTWAGATSWFPNPSRPQLLEAIDKFKPTFAPLVPTMYIGILHHPDIDKTDLTSIKGCFSGSAPLPVEVIKEFEERTGATIVEGYGLTESSPVTHINPYGEGSQRKVGSIGVPISDTICRIVGPQ